MKNLLVGLSLLALSATVSAGDFFGGNDGEWKMGPNGPYYEENDWPEWTPMYWMEEMMDSFDDNDNEGFFGNMPFGGNNYPVMPYAAPMAPAGYGVPMGYGVPVMTPGSMIAPVPAPAMPVAPAAPAVPGSTPGPVTAPAAN